MRALTSRSRRRKPTNIGKLAITSPRCIGRGGNLATCWPLVESTRHLHDLVGIDLTVRLRAPNGERIRRTAETANKALARGFHDRVKAELWRLAKLSAKPEHLWNEAVVRWLKEHAHKATAGEDVTKLRWLDGYLRGKPLTSINRSLIDAVTDAKLAQGVTNATVNRTLELLRAILRKCVDEWEWLERAPKISQAQGTGTAHSLLAPRRSAAAHRRAA